MRSSGDWPDEPHNACTSLEVVGVSRRNAPGNKTRSGGGSSGDNAHLSDGGYSAGATGDSAFGDGGEATGGNKSVLVLNGAACFIGGRLASTGESQVRPGQSRGRLLFCKHANAVSLIFIIQQGRAGLCCPEINYPVQAIARLRKEIHSESCRAPLWQNSSGQCASTAPHGQMEPVSGRLCFRNAQLHTCD